MREHMIWSSHLHTNRRLKTRVARGPDMIMNPVDEGGGENRSPGARHGLSGESGIVYLGRWQVAWYSPHFVLRMGMLLLKGGVRQEVTPIWRATIGVRQELLQISMEQPGIVAPLLLDLDDGKNGCFQQREAHNLAPTTSEC